MVLEGCEMLREERETEAVHLDGGMRWRCRALGGFCSRPVLTTSVCRSKSHSNFMVTAVHFNGMFRTAYSLDKARIVSTLSKGNVRTCDIQKNTITNNTVSETLFCCTSWPSG